MEKVKRKTKSDTRQPTNGRKREQGLRLFPSPKRLVEKKREEGTETRDRREREKRKREEKEERKILFMSFCFLLVNGRGQKQKGM